MYCHRKNTSNEGMEANQDCKILWYKNQCWVSK